MSDKMSDYKIYNPNRMSDEYEFSEYYNLKFESYDNRKRFSKIGYRPKDDHSLSENFSYPKKLKNQCLNIAMFCFYNN